MHSLAVSSPARAAGISLLLPGRRIKSRASAIALLAAALAVEAPTFAQAPDTIYLTGTIYDFSRSHPDFNITDSDVMGHYVHNVASILSPDDRPIYTAGGTEMTTEWLDQLGEPIMPYLETNSGLPGGHFDVDVYKEGPKKAWHKHEFDDAYDVTHINIADDTKLLFDKLVGDNDNDLRLEFFNTHNGGGGTYKFKTYGGPNKNGVVSNGFSPIFSPSDLQWFRVDFYSLLLLRQTNPKLVKKDPINHDEAFTVRMYDVVTNDLIYEVSVYTHVEDGDITPPPPPPPPSVDSCGVALNDTEGTTGSSGTAGVTGTWSFDTWFDNILGTNLSKHHTIALERDMGGVYEYCDNAFWPVDGLLLGNEHDAHNNFFTYDIASTFTYNGCTGQFVEFEGNDDAWVYINDQLVIDLGGVNPGTRQRIDLDRLYLTDGQQYTLDFFYAHRRPSPSSLFCMRTNIELGTRYMGSINPTGD